MRNEELVKAMIGHALESRPLDFQTDFDEVMRDRCEAAVETRKAQLATTMFSSSDTGQNREGESE